jgi:hypothetical protein
MSDYESFEPVDSQVDLSSFDDEFETAEAPSYEEVPDGKYQVMIQTAKLESSQKGDPMIKFDLEIISGSQAGRHIFKNSVITQASLPYVTGDLTTLGLGLAKFSELANRLEELLDVTLEVTKRTRPHGESAESNRFSSFLGFSRVGKFAFSRKPIPLSCDTHDLRQRSSTRLPSW